MNERGSGLKTTSNKFMESVFTWNSLGNDLVYPPGLAIPEESIKVDMLPCCYLHKMGHTSHCSWKGIVSPMLQEAESLDYVYTFMYLEEYTLTESIPESESEKSLTKVKIKMSASESCITNSVSLKFPLVCYKYFLSTNVILKETESSCVFYSNYFFNITALCYFKVLLQHFMWPPLPPHFYGMPPLPSWKKLFSPCTPQIPPAPSTS